MIHESPDADIGARSNSIHHGSDCTFQTFRLKVAIESRKYVNPALHSQGHLSSSRKSGPEPKNPKRKNATHQRQVLLFVLKFAFCRWAVGD